MNDYNSEIYLLGKDEFVLLAAASGIQSLYGLDLNVKETNREKALLTIHSLQQKGYLAGDEKFVPCREMKSIFDVIKNADTVMEIHKSSGRTCMVYIGSMSVRVVESIRRKDVFEVAAVRTAELWNHLTEEGWITEYDDIG